MSDEKTISLGGAIDENAPPIQEPAANISGETTLATPFETPAEAYIPTQREVQKVVDKKPEQVKKKRGKLLKGLIITFASLIFILVITAGILFFLLVYDDMPAAPTETTKTFDIVYDTLDEFTSDSGRMEFTTSEVNGLYEKVKPSIESAVESIGATLKESFIVINDNKVTYYARVNYKGITLPVRIILNIKFDDPYACVVINKIKVGQFSVPESFVAKFLADVDYPEGIVFDKSNVEFRYNTENLNDIFIGYIRKNNFMTGVEDFLDWGAGIFGGTFSYEDTLDITITECKILDNKLVFTIGKVFS